MIISQKRMTERVVERLRKEPISPHEARAIVRDEMLDEIHYMLTVVINSGSDVTQLGKD